MLPINITFRVRDSLSPGPHSEGSSHAELRRHLFPEPQTRSALLVANDLRLSEGKAGFVLSCPHGQPSTSTVRAGPKVPIL